MKRYYSPSCPDVIILGAGVAGLGTAVALAKKKIRVCVVQKSLPGEASPAAAGILDPFLGIEYPDYPTVALNLGAFHFFKKHLAELSENPKQSGYLKTGLLYLAMNSTEKKTLEARYAWQRKFDIAVKQFSSREIQKQEPSLQREFESGVFYPSVGRVLPKVYLERLRVQCRERGVRFVFSPHAQVLSSKGHVTGISLGSVMMPCEKVVYASGAWTRLSWAGKRFQVSPVRGVIAEWLPKLPQEKIRTVVHDLSGHYVAPWTQETLILGATVENTGYQARIPPLLVKTLCKRLQSFGVAPSGYRIKRAWAGFRPMSPDQLPVIGGLGTSGLYLAGGYYRSGILVGAYTGELLAENIICGTIHPVLKPFSPMRFLKP